MIRKSPIPRSRKPIARSPIKKRPRAKSEFARIYGSKARVEFVKGMECIYCDSLSPFFGIQTAGKCHNAHTVNGGRGRKADYNTIVPLCASHHRRYDAYEHPFERTSPDRQWVKDTAAKVEELWLESSGGFLEDTDTT